MNKLIKEQIRSQKNQRDTLNKKINQLERQVYQSEIEPKMKRMIGKCFKYRNSYGSGSKDWWLYSKIIDYKPQDQVLVVCSYQRTSDGRIEITVEETRHVAVSSEDHLFQIPITLKQFSANLDRAIKELEKMKTI